MNVEELKEKGNACIKEGNYAGATLHYSEAIKLDPHNFALFSNRSLAFLRMQQYYYAYKDAKRVIEINPEWAKGYFRQAEVEMATFHFDKALTSYTRAFCLQKDDHSLMDAMKKAARELKKDQRAEKQIPWIGAGVGIILGVIIVIADFVLVDKPALGNPLVKMLVTIAVSLLGFGFCKGYRWYVLGQRDSLIQPPADLLGEDDADKIHEESNETASHKSEIKDSHKKYSKAQSRQRYKKGKSS